MTTAVNASPDEDIYDPDNPPEDRGFLGILTVTAHVDGDKVTPSYGEQDARIVETVQKYTTNPKVNYVGPVWFLEGEGVDVVRSDGVPFRQHDIIKLRSSKGANLGKKQTPDQMALAFQAHGVTASYTKVGEPNSAVGRMFQFANTDLKLGGGFTKSVAMFPKALMDEGFVYDGPVRTVTPRAERNDSGASADGGAADAPDEGEAISILVDILTGKRPDQMMDIIIGEPRLAAVASVFGVPLLDAATDESLATVLAENGAMKLTDNGKLLPA